jgi:sortase A
MAGLCAVVAVAAFCFPTLSNWYAASRQHQLAGQLDDPTLSGQLRGGAVGEGRPIGRISIPALGLDAVVVQGTSAGDLAAGPGHYASTAMPCAAGNTAIAGHRTTFLHPFYFLDRLRPGDVITLTTPAATCSYRVAQAPFAVAPTDTAAIAATAATAATAGGTLTLTTCTPRGSAAKRLVVKAVLVPRPLRPATASGSG